MLNPATGISPTRGQKFAGTVMGLTSTWELHAEAVVSTSESKQTLQTDIQFQMKVMVKQTRKDPNNISILKINASL